MIFVQIASYRDPELLPTICDCLEKAKFKRDLVFGICWQRDAADTCLDAFKDRKEFRIDDVPWQDSHGLGWARARVQQMYQGEDFTLQLDSHHRFAEGWDEKLLTMLELTGVSKPILTSYAGIYDPATNVNNDDGPYKMVAERFTESGTILFRPQHIQGWRDMQRPLRARFVSGHYFFTIGRHCDEYRYDPLLYFAGDEISLSIRSFTLGYDLFHPHRTILWHEYSRQGRPKHWDNHTDENTERTGITWHERDALSKRRLRKMLREEDNSENITGFELGLVREHGDYERYAGIDFAGRRLQRETILGIEPPCTFAGADVWESGFSSRYCQKLTWNLADLEACEDIQFIYFGLEDTSGRVVYRYDAPPGSSEALRTTNTKEVDFLTTSTPAKLIIWPVSRTRGWLRKVEYSLPVRG
jgi:hypothetical protein